MMYFLICCNQIFPGASLCKNTKLMDWWISIELWNHTYQFDPSPCSISQGAKIIYYLCLCRSGVLVKLFTIMSACVHTQYMVSQTLSSHVLVGPVSRVEALSRMVACQPYMSTTSGHVGWGSGLSLIEVVFLPEPTVATPSSLPWWRRLLLIQLWIKEDVIRLLQPGCALDSGCWNLSFWSWSLETGVEDLLAFGVNSIRLKSIHNS